MFYTFAEALEIIPYIILAKKPILIRGPHGIGKSEIAQALKARIASILEPDEKKRTKRFGSKDYIYPVVERRASQMPDAGDLMGLPQLDGETTSFLPMKWFWQACTEAVLLFFDECDRGNQDVRQALFELTDSRKLAGHHLHPDTVIIACVNGGAGDNAYTVGDMDPAELSRWSVIDIRPSHDEFMSYSKGKINDIMWDFLKQNPGQLEHTKEFEPNKVYPCRRSWFRLNEALSHAPARFMDDAPHELCLLANVFIGHETAVAFHDFVKNYAKQVSVEDILVKGEFKKAKKLEINQHMAIIDKFESHDLFKKEMDPSVMQNLGRYILSVQPELAMKIWEVTTRLNPKNGIALHKVKVDGNSVGQYLARQNGAPEKKPAA
jgi:hypothetical protein